MKTKILFILPTLHAGGAENYALRFINHYKDLYDFHVLTVNTRKGDLHEQFTEAGATIFYQSIGYFNPGRLYKLYKLYKNHKIDVLCTFNGNFGGLPIAVARMAGIKNRIAFYRRSTNAFGNNVMKLFYNNIAINMVRKHATSILSNSEYAFKNFHGKIYKNDPRFQIISNGVDDKLFNLTETKEDARRILNLPAGAFIAGHIGRFDPAKNHPTIFRVIQRLKALESGVVFVFCGKGTDTDAFQQKLREHHISEHVICLGLQENIPLVLKSFDVFYFPSVTEGQPNAMIEAMLSGLPVIASNIPPILEALPKEAHSLMADAMEVEKVAATIIDFKQHIENMENYRFKEWGADKFDHVKNFSAFEKILTNGK